jgi:hypothetical protein
MVQITVGGEQNSMEDKLSKLKLMYGGAVSEVAKGEIYEVNLEYKRLLVYKDKVMDVGQYKFANKTTRHIVLKSISTDILSVQLIDLCSYKQYIVYDRKVGYSVLTDLSMSYNNIIIADKGIKLIISRYIINGIVKDIWIKGVLYNNIIIGVSYLDTKLKNCTLTYDIKRNTWSIDNDFG